MNDEVVSNEIADSLSYHLKDIKSESKDSYCSTLRQKFVKHQATIEDTIVILNQQSGEKEMVLRACKQSKLLAAVSFVSPTRKVKNYYFPFLDFLY